MPKRKKDQEREERIRDEAVVDAYGPEEQAIGWYYYLEEKLVFPFTATCVAERAISTLRKGDEVEVLGMASEDECRHDMFVGMRWEGRRTLAVPLAQLEPISETDEDTKEAVADWHYWVAQGYEF
ncbi:MAG: calcium-binding protein [Planctomycetota bacterium]